MGFIKIDRRMLDNPVVFKDPDHIAVWIYLLLEAAWKEHDTVFCGRVITLKPGQLPTGRKKISDRTGVQESKVKRILKFFESNQLIDQQSERHGTLISIRSWDRYQQSDQQNDQQVTNKWTTTDQQVTTTEEKKEGKKRKKSINNLYSRETEEVIYYLNEVTGQHYKTTTQKTIDLITRWLKQDFTVSDFKEVIDKKSRQWMGDERMQKFLRPETLFGNKFEGYLNETVSQKREGRLDWIDDI